MQQGLIFQINASQGGVPKTPLRRGEVAGLGLTVDQQHDRRHHGGPDRALCLYSLERIQALQAEGHPIYPGSTGENVTISGLNWSQLTPGRRLRLGQSVQVEVTGYAVPCQNIRESFQDERFSRISHKTYPGWSRLYVRVLEPGHIQIGDGVELLAVGSA